MNQAIANIIKGHIEGLDFVDKIAGLVAPLTFEIKDKDNNLVQKTVPIACCVTADDCKEGAYNELMPDSSYKTVIYFEDAGVTFERAESNWKYFTSNLRLVCWINIEKLTESGDCKSEVPCTYAAHIIADIIRVLPDFASHHNPFNHVYTEIISQEVRNPAIFGAYTYDEKHSQYLMAPFDYFALNLKTTFAICMKGTGVYDAECGHRTDTLDAPVATAGVSGKYSFIANWNAVTGASGYTIDVATDSQFNNSVLHDVRLGNILTVNVSQLQELTTYYYRIRSYNDYAESLNSNVITVTTLQVTFIDWFLPSKDAVHAMRTELFLSGVGSFSDGFYWSSSEYDANNSWQERFLTGIVIEDNKFKQFNIRACRAFTSTTVYALRDIGPAGGLVFWKSGNNYLEAAPTDQSSSKEWTNITYLAVTGTGTAIGTGQANTTAIIAQPGHIDSAAKLCNDLIVNNP